MYTLLFLNGKGEEVSAESLTWYVNLHKKEIYGYVKTTKKLG